MDIRTLRLRKAFKESGLTQTEICEKTGINKGALSSYLAGRYFPKQKTLEQLSKILKVSISYLMGIDEPSSLEGITNIILPAAYPLPILGEICAGNGIFCEENYSGIFYVDKSIKADFCLEIKGDSMEDAEIHNGDIAFIKRNFDYESGKIYAVRIEEDCEAVLKRVYFEGETVVLNPCNVDYQPIIKKVNEVTMLGECVGTYHAV